MLLLTADAVTGIVSAVSVVAGIIPVVGIGTVVFSVVAGFLSSRCC